MKDEIKEILDRLYVYLYKVQNDFGFEILNKREIELLYSYITNLQQIEEEHQKINGELRDTINKSLDLIETWDNEGLPATTIVGHIYSDLVPMLKDGKNEKAKETKPITKEDIEAIGYACGEIKKCFEKGWNKALEYKPLEEDKKIEPNFTGWKMYQDGKEVCSMDYSVEEEIN